MGARRRPEARWPEAGEAEAGGQRRNVREQVVQDRLGRRQEAGRGHQAGQEGPGLRQEYRIPRVDRPGSPKEPRRGDCSPKSARKRDAVPGPGERPGTVPRPTLPVHFRRDNPGK